MFVACWLLSVFLFLFVSVVDFCLFPVCWFSLFVNWYVLFPMNCSWVAGCCLLCAVCWSLVECSLFVVCCAVYACCVSIVGCRVLLVACRLLIVDCGLLIVLVLAL